VVVVLLGLESAPCPQFERVGVGNTPSLCLDLFSLFPPFFILACTTHDKRTVFLHFSFPLILSLGLFPVVGR
jgi:hypothetical protein